MRTCGGFERSSSCHVEGMSTSTQGNPRSIMGASSWSSGFLSFCTLKHIATCFSRCHGNVPSTSFGSWAGPCGCISPFVSNGDAAALPCRVDLKKLRGPVLLSEWRRLMDISWSQPDEEFVDHAEKLLTRWLHCARGGQERLDGAMALGVTG